MLPSQYRKTHIQLSESEKQIEDQSNNIDTQLISYLHNYEVSDILIKYSKPSIKKIEFELIDTNHKKRRLKHNYKKIFPNCDSATLLYSNMQQYIKIFQQEIHFSYIYLSEIFREEIGIYTEHSTSNEIYNFRKIDIIINFLLSINLKPIIDLGQLPSSLSDSLNKVEYPMAITRWRNLIKNTIVHFIDQYGLTEVETWQFYTSIKLINLPSSLNQPDFCFFYYETYKTVKLCNPKLSFGSSPLEYISYSTNNSLVKFYEFCSNYNCHPDFIHFIHYPTVPVLENENYIQKKHSVELHLNTVINNIKKYLNQIGWDKKPLYLCEWGSTRYKSKLLNDTIFNAAYITHTVLQNYDSLDGYSYCNFVDLPFHQYQISNCFYGDTGLITHNGISKASYKAFTLLNHLGNYLIYKNQGCFITRENNKIKGVLYNYKHSVINFLDLLSKEQEKVSVPVSGHINYPSDTMEGQAIKYDIPLSGLSYGKYYLIEIILNSEFGSSFEKWKALGEYPFLHEYDIAYLNQISIMELLRKEIHTNSGIFNYTREVKPYEIRYFELTPE